jgi:DNA uptake protein ComE-like DNA-binding protein
MSRTLFVCVAWLSIALLFTMTARLAYLLRLQKQYGVATPPAAVQMVQWPHEVAYAPPKEVVVQVVGAVRQPGVYHLKPEGHAIDALLAAHGQTANANLDVVNLAAPLVDGMSLYIPTHGDNAQIYWTNEQDPDSAMVELVSQTSKRLVHVSGAVQRPGVYLLPATARNIDALIAAEGPAKQADLNAVNLAAKVMDGMHLRIPDRKEVIDRDRLAIANTDDAVVPDEAQPKDIVVHVAGAVRRSGVYHFKSGQRNGDALKAASGPTSEANLDAINLATPLYDGAQVYFPTRHEQSRGGAEPTTFVMNLSDPAKVKIAVHVAGAVKRPGLYYLNLAARYDDALRAAGGVTSRANLVGIKLAAPLEDGVQFYVPARGEH